MSFFISGKLYGLGIFKLTFYWGRLFQNHEAITFAGYVDELALDTSLGSANRAEGYEKVRWTFSLRSQPARGGYCKCIIHHILGLENYLCRAWNLLRGWGWLVTLA